MKKKLIVSASGGRTSMLMSIWLDLALRDTYDLTFLFCNTGQEDDETLDFVQRVDEKWGLGVIWLEAVTHHDQRKGCTYKVVNHATASRNGEPFEDMIKKYGIPNKAYPHCNRELKLNPMFNWRRDNWPDAEFAVGIRIDEIDRMAATAERDRVIYPFIKMNPTTKLEVIDWWKQYPEIDLRIPEHHGNCKTCWKKSDRKLMTIALEDPEKFKFMDRMEQELGDCGANDDTRVFFRSKRSARALVGEAYMTDFTRFTDPHELSEMDYANGCSESCEVFAEA